MKRRLTLIILSTLVMFSLLGGVTYAYFSDSQESNNNKFQAGTLKIQVLRDMGDSNPGPLYYVEAPAGTFGWKNATGLWAPGDTNHRILIVRNQGSIASALKSVQAVLTSGSRHLADKLQVKLTTDTAGNNVIASGTLGEFIDNAQEFNPGPVNVGAMTQINFWVTMPEDADNSYQGETLQVSFNVLAGQK